MAGQAFSILNNFSSANAQRNSVFARNNLGSNFHYQGQTMFHALIDCSVCS